MKNKKKASVRKRFRPSFEINPVIALALTNYMRDEEIRQQSVVLRKALKQFLPQKYIEQAQRELNGGKVTKAA
jgi:hypothetical protein